VLRRPILVVAVLAGALGLSGCGGRVEPTGGDAPRAVADGAGGTVTATATGPILTTEPGAAETLAALGVGPVELVEATAVAERLTATPAPRLVVLGASIETDAAVPILRWSTADPRATGGLIVRLGLALGRGADGVRVARTTDAAIDDVLRRVRAEPPVRALLEGPAAGELAVLVSLLGGVPSGYRGIAATVRDDPEVWLATPGATTTLRRLRATAELRRVTAVDRKRFAIVDPADFGPSPRLAERLAALADLLHPAS
jgi:hypothetical protein